MVIVVHFILYVIIQILRVFKEFSNILVTSLDSNVKDRPSFGSLFLLGLTYMDYHSLIYV